MLKINSLRATALFLLATIIVGITSCTSPSFYKKAYGFNKTIASGDFEAAEAFLEEHKDLEDSKVRFLYFVNAGMVEHLKGDFEKSNEYFEKADLFVEDERKDALEEGAALLLNPNISTYHGEDHEVLLINYYKALNYYLLGNTNDALVEVRRLNLRLQSLSEKYKDDTKYTQDAYMHVVMGLIYEANKDYNNAFIAYRNAHEIYQGEYSTMFGISTPEQLKEDIIRTAALSAMFTEKQQYEKEFDMKYTPSAHSGSMVMIWHNGMGPIKEEWGINFAIVYTGNGWVNFVSKEYGLSYPFYVGNTNLNGLTWVKVAFPKYVERDMLINKAVLYNQDEKHELQLAENINAISFKVLDQRMGLEFSKALLRVALKQAAAYKIGESQDSPALGAALSIAASATENADTRNWQTLPHSIYYVRVPLEEGNHELNFKLQGVTGIQEEHEIEVSVQKGQTVIYPFYTLAASDPLAGQVK
ncbi:MAG: COG3014 family protein [Salibacteraceae bacterium]